MSSKVVLSKVALALVLNRAMRESDFNGFYDCDATDQRLGQTSQATNDGEISLAACRGDGRTVFGECRLRDVITKVKHQARGKEPCPSTDVEFKHAGPLSQRAAEEPHDGREEDRHGLNKSSQHPRHPTATPHKVSTHRGTAHLPTNVSKMRTSRIP